MILSLCKRWPATTLLPLPAAGPPCALQLRKIAVLAVALPLLAAGCSGSPGTGKVVVTTPYEPQRVEHKVVTFDVQGCAFIQLEPGAFIMGSRGIEPGHQVLEHRRDVAFTSPVAMSQYEITTAQYWRIVDPAREVDPDRADYPMTGVSWEEAQEFCEKLTSLEAGKRFRLPTEAEWEYACRAGEERMYSVWRGDNWRANLDDAVEAYNEGSRSKLSRRASSSFCFDENTAARVGQYKPNPWGFYDMHGNVWEWCNPSGNELDGDGPTLQHRPIRGGAWSSPSCLDCRSAKRAFEHKGSKKGAIGLRLLIENP